MAYIGNGLPCQVGRQVPSREKWQKWAMASIEKWLGFRAMNITPRPQGLPTLGDGQPREKGHDFRRDLRREWDRDEGAVDGWVSLLVSGVGSRISYLLWRFAELVILLSSCGLHWLVSTLSI